MNREDNEEIKKTDFEEKTRQFTAGNINNVLYLHNRKLWKVPTLPSTYSQVTKLYLQNNCMSEISGLEVLPLLQLLDLSHNHLRIINGLQHCHNLEDLNIERQFILEKQNLKFDPRSISGIKDSLKILNCSGNNLEELGYIVKLINLRQLDLSSNKFSNLKKLSNDLENLPNLSSLNLTKNKVCQQNGYIKSIVGYGNAMGNRLEELDGRSLNTGLKRYCYFRRNALKRKTMPHDLLLHTIKERCQPLSTGIKTDLEQRVLQEDIFCKLTY